MSGCNVTHIAYSDRLIPFDDTYVLYDPDDVISFIACYFTLLPIAILVFYLSWFIVSREIEAVFMAGGQVANDLLNNIVKNMIKQPRPYNFGSFQQESLRSAYGMPSAHSQFMGFFAVYQILRLWYQWTGLDKSQKSQGTVSAVLTMLAVAGSRVYLGYHTIAQVAVGVAIGALFGFLYYSIVGLIRSSGFSDQIMAWPIAKWLLVKDSCFYSPVSLREEYEAYWKRLDAKKLEGNKKDN